MKPSFEHVWNLTEQEAIQLQTHLAKKVISSDEFLTIDYVAGVDVAYSKYNNTLIAGIVILDMRSLDVTESVVVEDDASFPYIPGLFSFRELPPVAKAFSQIKTVPQLVVCDGQGVAHPRRFGLACHLGVLYDIPTIGCGKTRLCGEYIEPSPERGSSSPLIDQTEIIGNVLRTQTNVKPIFVSVGHKISLPTANQIVLQLATKYRLPETTRQADQLVNARLKR
ncbi:deoxyribonuclease V [Paenibacillus hunanensis]|uniref:Endonuclease V n=1 Tax=Paenibacillus hunanensis TaxID=539262 RepID=A0ABU1J1Z8_9BACL|nr:deoxyribonuclease V [Paenibacillus hunanensis]MCL9660365.1 deoxyribonuclease V [Paenibacillus hunanensis]MDR6245534.1 deoxyribonuclease V [Paenibacillus hunanensis]WPP42983.1 deoxyribonuclease V [Paenibacillus hunanensis]GGJ09800.1 endonuclease V [Paenibacillus hunanensis]